MTEMRLNINDLGNVLIRSENGLGEGILLTCQYDEDLGESSTFGPLPLDFFT